MILRVARFILGVYPVRNVLQNAAVSMPNAQVLLLVLLHSCLALNRVGVLSDPIIKHLEIGGMRYSTLLQRADLLR